MTAVMEAEATTTSPARVSRGLPLPGRRRQRAAGERIAVLFEEHGRMVYGISRLLLRDSLEAEDAAQQTFLSAYRALLAGHEPREPSAWLGTIARNECRARLRARQAEPLTIVQEPAGDDFQRDVGRREEIQALCVALGELPRQQRDAVVLREFYGLSYAEVAAALGLSGPAVESLLFRGRKRLQEQLRPVRSALGVLTLPVTLQESLAQALPGFGSGAASTGAGGAVLAKLASAPLLAKLGAATLAVGTVGTVAGVERSRHVRSHRSAAAARAHPVTPHARVTPVPAAARASEPEQVAAAEPVSLRATPVRTHTSAPPRSEGERGRQGTSSGGGGGEVEHRSAPASPSRSSSGSGSETVDTAHDGGSTGLVELGSGGSGSGDSGSGGSGDRGATGESGHDGSGDRGPTGPTGDSGGDGGSGSGH